MARDRGQDDRRVPARRLEAGSPLHGRNRPDLLAGLPGFVHEQVHMRLQEAAGAKLNDVPGHASTLSVCARRDGSGLGEQLHLHRPAAVEGELERLASPPPAGSGR